MRVVVAWVCRWSESSVLVDSRRKYNRYHAHRLFSEYIYSFYGFYTTNHNNFTITAFFHVSADKTSTTTQTLPACTYGSREQFPMGPFT